MTISQKNGTVRIGTSGWQYDHWHGPFYPADLKKKDFFSFYTRYFPTVEINSSFYRLPGEKSLQSLYENSPEDFLFSIKASRYITHMKKLKNPEEAIGRFFDRIKLLKDKCGPVLFQLPPNWKANPERLVDFTAALPKGYACAFEFRDPTWFNKEIYQILNRHNAALCIYGMGKYESPRDVTADFVYVRLHGPKQNYRRQYTDEALGKWAAAFARWTGSGKRVYCYFDNDEKGYAASDARRMAAMTEEIRSESAG